MKIYTALLLTAISAIAIAPCHAAQEDREQVVHVKGCALPLYPKIASTRVETATEQQSSLISSPRVATIAAVDTTEISK